MDINVFDKYAMNVLRPPNIETGETELNMISDKYQDKDKFILNNEFGDTEWIQITDMIKVIETPITGKLDDVTWIHYKNTPLLEDNNITKTLKKYDRGAKWFTDEEKNWNNDSSNFINVEECTLFREMNSCDVIDAPVIAITFENEYIIILHDMSKWYMYSYFVSKLIQ